jgi:hypothetical protein
MTKLTLALALVLSAPMSMFASSALAKNPFQNHHCMKDGKALPDKTHKQCSNEGGTWEKDAAAPKAAAAPDKKPSEAEKKSELGADRKGEPPSEKAEPPAEKKAEPVPK